MAVPLRPGDPGRLGRYTVVARLGQGGMGSVFLGHAPGGRQVAIKVIRPEYADEPEYRGRFRSEVNRARQVPPFSTAEVLDADPDHDPPYLVVEYVEGPSLAAVVDRRGPLTGAALHTLAVGTATALSAIHHAGVVHRDLKPENVLLPHGGVKVIDFGIARPLEATSHHTATDHMVGTVAYMAPERFEDGRTAGFASDIFAWGALVVYAATGRTPFHAESPPATAMRILTQPPDLAGVPYPLRGLVGRALAKDSADRPAARDLLDELLAGPPPDDPPVPAAPPAVPASPARRRGPRRAAVAVAAVGLLAAAGLTARSFAATGDGSPAAKRPAAPDALAGGRRSMIHIVETGEDLWIYPNGGEAETTRAAEGLDPVTLFTLVPTGSGHEIRWLSPEYPGNCLGVRVKPGESTGLVTVPCGRSPATVFTIRPSGRTDASGLAAYTIVSPGFGTVEWSGKDRRVVVTEGDQPARTTFTFPDRGPA
ncbi:hypothetical protein Asp14428_08800 [Actinoplanes sp. NBRC 14428]|nr:hypothetical protein Asp14428_08800 [Actinoplanes sp. NBRC 14428]